MPSQHSDRMAEAQRHEQELDALTLRLESAEADRSYLLAENRRLLASLFEEQRQAAAIRRACHLPESATHDETTRTIGLVLEQLRGWRKAAPPCPPAPEVAPEAPVKGKRARKAKEGGQ